MAVTLTMFLFSLAGIPPLAGWFAKFVMFRAALDAQNATGTVLAVIAGVASVVAFVYYANVVKRMWLEEPAEIEEVAQETRESGGLLVATHTSTTTPPAVKLAILVCATATIVIGILPGIVASVGELVTTLN